MEHATASGTVSLEGMAFFARHGFYEEERTLGNRYEVDIAVETPLETPPPTTNWPAR
jgi:dihydroneopterin aldolase